MASYSTPLRLLLFRKRLKSFDIEMVDAAWHAENFFNFFSLSYSFSSSASIMQRLLLKLKVFHAFLGFSTRRRKSPWRERSENRFYFFALNSAFFWGHQTFIEMQDTSFLVSMRTLEFGYNCLLFCFFASLANQLFYRQKENKPLTDKKRVRSNNYIFNNLPSMQK